LSSGCTCRAVLVFRELAEALRTALGLPTVFGNTKIEEFVGIDGAVVATRPMPSTYSTQEPEDLRLCNVECKRWAEALSMALFLGTGAAGRVASASCTCASISETDRHKSIAVREMLEIFERVDIRVEQKVPWRDIVIAAERICSFMGTGGRVNRILRFLKLYRDGELEEDPVDKFFDMWRAFENWYKHKYEQHEWQPSEQYSEQPDEQCEERKRSGERWIAVAALKDFCGIDEGEAKMIYRLRSALFHEGVESVEGMSLNEALGVILRCVGNKARRLWKDLTGAATQPGLQ